MNTRSAPLAIARPSARWSALVALAFGVLVVYGAGFSAPMMLHNATHDTRHAFGLPCH